MLTPDRLAARSDALAAIYQHALDTWGPPPSKPQQQLTERQRHLWIARVLQEVALDASAERKTAVRQARRAGATPTQIAQQLGISRQAVHAMLHR